MLLVCKVAGAVIFGEVMLHVCLRTMGEVVLLAGEVVGAEIFGGVNLRNRLQTIGEMVLQVRKLVGEVPSTWQIGMLGEMVFRI